MKLNPTTMADAAVELARCGQPVEEVWLLAQDLVDQAVAHAYDTGVFPGSWGPGGRTERHPAFVTPIRYRLLLAVTPGLPVAIVHSGRPPGDQLHGGLMCRPQDRWEISPTSVIDALSDEARLQMLQDLTAWMYARWWATTSTTARQRAYCRQVDQGDRSLAHREIPTISVVQWRKYVRRESEMSRDVEWSHRWVVRGHLRRLSDGRVVEVREHLKGPRGLPLVVKAHVDTLVR